MAREIRHLGLVNGRIKQNPVQHVAPGLDHHRAPIADAEVARDDGSVEGVGFRPEPLQIVFLQKFPALAHPASEREDTINGLGQRPLVKGFPVLRSPGLLRWGKRRLPFAPVTVGRHRDPVDPGKIVTQSAPEHPFLEDLSPRLAGEHEVILQLLEQLFGLLDAAIELVREFFHAQGEAFSIQLLRLTMQLPANDRRKDQTDGQSDRHGPIAAILRWNRSRHAPDFSHKTRPAVELKPWFTRGIYQRQTPLSEE